MCGGTYSWDEVLLLVYLGKGGQFQELQLGPYYATELTPQQGILCYEIFLFLLHILGL